MDQPSADLTTLPTMEQGSFLLEHGQAVAEAARRIAPHVRHTPTLTTDLDPRLLLKAEPFQVTGSFKARGAFNAVLSLLERTTRGNRPEGVVAVSSGNHAQALALAASAAGLKAVVLIAEDANPAKVAATRAYGAEVIQEGVTFANREERLRQLMQERPELALIHPFDDWDIIHGQGTAARELLQEHPETAVIATPVGGGGLLSGTAIAGKYREPLIKVIGVEPEQADDAFQTLRRGEIQTLPAPPTTLADGVRTVSIGRRNFEVMVTHRLVDDIVTVSEDEIAEGLRSAWTRARLALEPTGALPLAAHLAGKLPEPAAKGRTALILSGGNADLALVARLLSR